MEIIGLIILVGQNLVLRTNVTSFRLTIKLSPHKLKKTNLKKNLKKKKKKEAERESEWNKKKAKLKEGEEEKERKLKKGGTAAAFSKERLLEKREKEAKRKKAKQELQKNASYRVGSGMSLPQHFRMRRNSNPNILPGKEADPLLTSLFNYLELLIPPLIHLVYAYARSPVEGKLIDQISIPTPIIGLAIDDHNIYLTTSGMLKVYTKADLRCIHKWDLLKLEESDPGTLWSPGHVAVDYERVYVVDQKVERIIVLNKETGFVRYSFSQSGLNQHLEWTPTEMWKPGLLALDDDNLYIVDSGTHRLTVFLKNGEFIRKGKKPYETLKKKDDIKTDIKTTIKETDPLQGLKGPVFAVDEKSFYLLNLSKGGINVIHKETGKKIRRIGGEGKKYFKTVEKTKSILSITVDDYYLYVCSSNVIVFNKKTGVLAEEWGDHSVIENWRPKVSAIFRNRLYIANDSKHVKERHLVDIYQ